VRGPPPLPTDDADLDVGADREACGASRRKPLELTILAILWFRRDGVRRGCDRRPAHWRRSDIERFASPFPRALIVQSRGGGASTCVDGHLRALTSQINLPIAAPVLAIMLFFFHPVQRVSDMTIKQRLIRVDWAGTACATDATTKR